MTYIIPNPQTKELKQLNTHDLIGSIFTSKNIDLSDKGYIKLAHRTIAQMTENIDADFNNSDSIFKTDSDFYTIGSEVFRGNIGFSALTSIASDTLSPSPGPE